MILEDFDFPVIHLMIAKVDSSGAISIATYSQITSCSKHIDFKYHFIQRRIKKEEINLLKIDTKENIVDIFMKHLGPNVFWNLVRIFTDYVEVPYYSRLD